MTKSSTVEDEQGTSSPSCLPLNMVMKPFSEYQTCTDKVWLSPTFLSHQLGYKLRLAVNIQPLLLNDNPQLKIGIVSASEGQADYLKLPCIGDAKVHIINPQQNKRHKDISFGFIIPGDNESYNFTFALLSKDFVYKDCLFFRVEEVYLDEAYKPWLLDPYSGLDRF